MEAGHEWEDDITKFAVCASRREHVSECACVLVCVCVYVCQQSSQKGRKPSAMLQADVASLDPHCRHMTAACNRLGSLRLDGASKTAQSPDRSLHPKYRANRCGVFQTSEALYDSLLTRTC